MQTEAAQRPPSASVAAHAPAVPLRRILGSFWPYTATRRKWMLLALLLSAADPVLMAVEIWLFKVVVDDVLVPRDFAPFPMIAAGYLGLTLLQAVLGAADRMLSTWLTQRFLLDLRSELLRHLQRLPLDFFTRSRLGDLMARLAGDVSAIESFLVSGTNRALRYALELVIFTIALFVLDPTLALVSLVVAPLFWASSRYFSRRIKTISREKQRRSGSINTSIEQTLSTMPPRARLRRRRARGRALPRRGRGEVPSRDGLGPAALGLLAHGRAHRARRRAGRDRRGRLAALARCPHAWVGCSPS